MALSRVSLLVLLISVITQIEAATFPRPVAFLIMYHNDNTSNQYFHDSTPYNTTDTSSLFIPDPSPTYLIQGTDDIRIFEWSRNTEVWKIRNVRLS